MESELTLLLEPLYEYLEQSRHLKKRLEEDMASVENVISSIKIARGDYADDFEADFEDVEEPEGY